MVHLMSVMYLVLPTTKQPTCFKGDISTLIGVFLTGRTKRVTVVLNVDMAVSDFHNYVGVVSRVFAPPQIRRKIRYPTMKNFQEEVFHADVENIPLHVANIFHSIGAKSVVLITSE